MLNPDMLPSEYLSFYSNKVTIDGYASSLKNYVCVVMGKRYTNLDEAWLDYLNSNRDYQRDLMNFVKTCQSLEDRQYAPLTIHGYLSIAERYLKDCCNIELTPLQKRLRDRTLPKHIVITKDATLEKKDIKTILSHCDERLTLEILLGVSGGMRIGEILGIKIEDVNLNSEPVEVRIRAEISKNGIARIVYISDEAVEAMKAWLKIREESLTFAKGRYKDKDKVWDESRIIPYSAINERKRFNRMLVKAGYAEIDPATRYHLVHYHSFRKYFITQFGKSDASKAVGEALAGHEGYLDSAYRRIPESQMKEEYLKALPKLQVLTPDDYEELKYSRAAEIADLQQTNTHLMAKLAVMEATLENVQKEQERQSVSLISGVPHRRLYLDDPEVTDAE